MLRLAQRARHLQIISRVTRVLARNFDALTLPDFLAARFLSVGDQARHPLRIAAAAVVMMCSLLYLVAVFKGAGHLFEQFLNVHMFACCNK